MPQVSDTTLRKTGDHVLRTLKEANGQQITTREVARRMARDKEFMGRILDDLEKLGFVKSTVVKMTIYSNKPWRYWAITDAGLKYLDSKTLFQ